MEKIKIDSISAFAIGYCIASIVRAIYIVVKDIKEGNIW